MKGLIPFFEVSRGNPEPKHIFCGSVFRIMYSKSISREQKTDYLMDYDLHFQTDDIHTV